MYRIQETDRLTEPSQIEGISEAQCPEKIVRILRTDAE